MVTVLPLPRLQPRRLESSETLIRALYTSRRDGSVSPAAVIPS